MSGPETIQEGLVEAKALQAARVAADEAMLPFSLRQGKNEPQHADLELLRDRVRDLQAQVDQVVSANPDQVAVPLAVELTVTGMAICGASRAFRSRASETLVRAEASRILTQAESALTKRLLDWAPALYPEDLHG